MSDHRTRPLRTNAVARLDDVAAERLDLARYLDDLPAAAWRTPSLCPGWTVHDVVAHLTLSTRETLPGLLRRMARARGSFDRANRDHAREEAAARPPAELVARLRETAGWSRRQPMSSPLDPLTDVLVHRQDIARPLGHPAPVDPDRAVAALDHVWGNVFYGRPSRRFAGLRFVATDAAWTSGEGPEVRGAAGALLLAAAGRAAGVADLDGPRAAEAATRLRREGQSSVESV
jgi:uncharacterized protein (TIGR03083 family)